MIFFFCNYVRFRRSALYWIGFGFGILLERQRRSINEKSHCSALYSNYVVFVILFYTVLSQIGYSQNLLGYWPLDGNAEDSEGDYDATVIGSPSWVADRNGSTQSAISLNGLSDYLLMSTAQSIKNMSGSYTIMGWIKMNALKNYNGIFLRSDSFTASNSQIEIYIDSQGKLNTVHNRENSGTFSYRYWGGDFTANVWYFVAIVWNGSSWTIYRNVTSTTLSTVNLVGGNSSSYSPNTGDNPYLGVGYAGNIMNGMLDDFRIYDYALNQASIESILSGGSQPTNTPTPTSNPQYTPTPTRTPTATPTATQGGGSLTWITNSSNGHQYALSTSRMTWTQAKTAAENAGGYLATITSSSEESWLESTFPSCSDVWVWIGLEKYSTGAWRWVTGETLSYTNWTSGQPSQSTGKDYTSKMYPPDSRARQWCTDSLGYSSYALFEKGGGGSSPTFTPTMTPTLNPIITPSPTTVLPDEWNYDVFQSSFPSTLTMQNSNSYSGAEIQIDPHPSSGSSLSYIAYASWVSPQLNNFSYTSAESISVNTSWKNVWAYNSWNNANFSRGAYVNRTVITDIINYDIEDETHSSGNAITKLNLSLLGKTYLDTGLKNENAFQYLRCSGTSYESIPYGETSITICKHTENTESIEPVWIDDTECSEYGNYFATAETYNRTFSDTQIAVFSIEYLFSLISTSASGYGNLHISAHQSLSLPSTQSQTTSPKTFLGQYFRDSIGLNSYPEHLNTIKNTCKNALGLDVDQGYYKIDITETDFRNNIGINPIKKIVYLFCHGYVQENTFRCIKIKPTNNNDPTLDGFIYPGDIQGNCQYQLIFLNSCGSCMENSNVVTDYYKQFTKQLRKDRFSSCYMGWNKIDVNATICTGFAENFFTELNNNTRIETAKARAQYSIDHPDVQYIRTLGYNFSVDHN